MTDPDDIADGYKKPKQGEEKVNGCTCSVFQTAVRDGFIKSPGARSPHAQSFSKRYFITRYDEAKEVHHFMYIDYCPNCGKPIAQGEKK